MSEFDDLEKKAEAYAEEHTTAPPPHLEELARDRCYTFAFVGIPLKFQGATGSPLRPLALV